MTDENGRLVINHQDVCNATELLKKTLPPPIALNHMDDLLKLHSHIELELRVGTWQSSGFTSGLQPKSWSELDHKLSNLVKTLDAYTQDDTSPFMAKRDMWEVLISTVDRNYIMTNVSATTANNTSGVNKLRSDKRQYGTSWRVNLHKLQQAYGEHTVIAPIYTYLGITDEQVAGALRWMALSSEQQLCRFDTTITRVDEHGTVEKRNLMSAYLIRDGMSSWSQHDIRLCLSSETICLIQMIPNRLIQTVAEKMGVVTNHKQALATATTPKQKRKTVTAEKKANSKKVGTATAATPPFPIMSKPSAIVAINSNAREVRLRLRKSWLLSEQYQVELNGQLVQLARPSWVIELTLAWHGQTDTQCAVKARAFYQQLAHLPTDSLLKDALKSYFEKEDIGMANNAAIQQASDEKWCHPTVELEVECTDIVYCHAMDAVWPGQLQSTLAKGVGIGATLLSALNTSESVSPDNQSKSLFQLRT